MAVVPHIRCSALAGAPPPPINSSSSSWAGQNIVERAKARLPSRWRCGDERALLEGNV